MIHESLSLHSVHTTSVLSIRSGIQHQLWECLHAPVLPSKIFLDQFVVFVLQYLANYSTKSSSSLHAWAPEVSPFRNLNNKHMRNRNIIVSQAQRLQENFNITRAYNTKGHMLRSSMLPHYSFNGYEILASVFRHEHSWSTSRLHGPYLVDFRLPHVTRNNPHSGRIKTNPFLLL